MNYSDYVKNFSFRFITPQTKLPLPDSYFESRLSNILASGGMGIPEKIGAFFDLINTKYPEKYLGIKSYMKKLISVPRMSTSAIGAIINRGVSEMNPDEAFVNVGIWFGFTFFSGLIGNKNRICIGIDNFSQFGGPKGRFLENFERFGGPKHHFHDIDYSDYLNNIHSGSIGFYIYDGPHDYENQLRGLRLAEPFFSENCIVLVDDTNWKEPREATYDFISTSKNKYEILLDIQTVQNCHPTYWNGLMLFRAHRPNQPDQTRRNNAAAA